MKAAQFTRPNFFEMIERPVPEPAEKDVVIRVRASGICGTDIHIFRGRIPGRVSRYPRA